MSERYRNSEKILERALKTIPLGSQTFSKSITQFPHGVSPYFLERGEGSKVWDVDGNEYIDFINSLASITLGYADENVNNAVSKQLANGVSFSLSNKLEVEVSEKLVDLIPCAEMVRFGKNGTDATSAAVRLARAYTKKDYVLVCGYHGWQDWYIGSTTRNLGVPEATQQLTKKFSYNDINSFDALISEYEGKIAAVILEPMNIEYPADGFLEHLRAVTRDKEIVLIFDETVTGFRYSVGGAQELFEITPDLATFGKGLANGFPLSAVVGSKSIMTVMEDIFYSGTFAGETVSLAAANEVIKRMSEDNIPAKLYDTGTYLLNQLDLLIEELKLESILYYAGHPSWSFLIFKDSGDYTSLQIKTYFMQEVLKRGILSLGTHNISASHSVEDIDKLIAVYKEVFTDLKERILNSTLVEGLNCKALEPLFKVR